MIGNILRGCAVVALGMSMCPPSAQSAPDAGPSIPVTVDTFVRAETDRYFKQRYEQGAFGRFHHERGPVDVDKQLVIRMNRDTPYSTGIFDLAQPLTIVKPDTKGRFQSILGSTRTTTSSA
jgi:hypothetical protein